MEYFRTLVFALAASGCVGSIIEPPGGDKSNPNGNAGTGAGGTKPGTNPGDPRLEARVWRLTPAQYNGEVQRFFPGAPAVHLPVGASEFGLTNISVGGAHRYRQRFAIQRGGAHDRLVGGRARRCRGALRTFGTTACVDTFLGWFPEAAYRRPPTAEEKAELRAVYDDLVPDVRRTSGRSPRWSAPCCSRRSSSTARRSVRAARAWSRSTTTRSPSLLSFSLTDAGPDEELLADAKAGKLRDPAVREAHARRLMDRHGRDLAALLLGVAEDVDAREPGQRDRARSGARRRRSRPSTARSSTTSSSKDRGTLTRPSDHQPTPGARPRSPRTTA